MAITTEELINKYPKIFQDYPGNPGRINWQGLPDGWVHVIDKLCGSIQEYVDTTTKYRGGVAEKIEQVTCVQMKEKYGGLRFYTNGNDDEVEGMIRMAEYICDHTCQDCGSDQDLGRTTGWVSVLCRSCAIAQGDRATMNWKPLKEQP